MIKSAVLLSLLAGAQAHIVPEKRQAPAFCSKVSKLVSSSCQPYVTNFCSSYVSVPLSTSTTTTSTSTITVPKSTITVKTTITRGTTATRTARVTSTETETVTETACSGPERRRVKRQASTLKYPPCLTTSYKPGASLSSACSCLSVKPSTTTVSVGKTTTITRGTSTTTSTSTVNRGTTTTVTSTTVVQATACAPADNLLTDPGFEDESSRWELTQAQFVSPGQNSQEAVQMQVGSAYGQSDSKVVQYLGGNLGILPRDPYRVIFSYNIGDVTNGGTYTIDVMYSVDVMLDSFTFTPADANSGWQLRVINTTIPYAYGDLTLTLHYPSDLSQDGTEAAVEIDNTWFFHQ